MFLTADIFKPPKPMCMISDISTLSVDATQYEQ